MKILVVDDETLLVKGIRFNLQNEGYDVILEIDINGYKQDRYKKVASMAHRLGRSVQKNRVDVKLDPMPGDERKVIHQALANMNYVRTESFGEGRNRYLTIIYDANKKKKTNIEE